MGETKVWFVGLVIKNCPPKSPPESFSSQGGREAYTGIIDYNLAAQDVQVSKGRGSVHVHVRHCISEPVTCVPTCPAKRSLPWEGILSDVRETWGVRPCHT